ncbi:hypothetical protein G8764_20750 [Pseudomaricurvus alcaniphilus]|nr:hypothetical protein [Pseudomaricurvus alcaniphilus]
MQVITARRTSLRCIVAALAGLVLLSGVAFASPQQGASVEELRLQQHQQKFKAFKQSRDKAAAEKDMAIRAEAARLIREKANQN